MGTAGLNVQRLQGLLEREKVDSVLVEGDEARDHVVLELGSVRRPNVVARLEYENQGIEPRIVSITVPSSNSSREIEISGKRDDDVAKIVSFVREAFLQE